MKFTVKILWLIAGSAITALFLTPVIFPSYRNIGADLIIAYPYGAPFIVIGFRFLGVVLAPLPGMPVAFASIALLPWWQAALYNFVGSAAGAVAAFFIARRFRERAAAYFIPLQKIREWQEAISERRQFWTLIAFRLFSLGAFDFVVYAIGLTSISFRTFFATILMVDLPVTIIFFYLGGIAINYSVYIFGAFMLLLFAVGFILRRVGRTI